jgi:molybdopterin-guanine dinucleotide biosynthesis protein A
MSDSNEAARERASLTGIFVGGRARRMGGVAKGLLRAPGDDRSLVERLAAIVRSSKWSGPLVLVGEDTRYASLALPSIADCPPGIGPLGGLIALLTCAGERNLACVLALACDLPFVDTALIDRLIEHAPEADAVLPRIDGVWQPLCARYRVAPSLRAARAVLAGESHSLQRVLDHLGANALALPFAAGDDALIRDWDAPDDVHD